MWRYPGNATITKHNSTEAPKAGEMRTEQIPHKVKPQRLEHRRLVYLGWFELVFKSLRNSSDRSRKQIQSNLNSSNTDGSFTMANSNLILSPYEILPMDQENKEAFLFHYKIVCLVYSLESHEHTQHTIFVQKIDIFPRIAIFTCRPSAMINLHWLELPMARTIFHCPKSVRAIKVRLY